MTKVMDGVEARAISEETAREIPFAAFARETSPTAASSHNRLYGPSGVMPYRVVVKNGKALTTTVVEAATGDDAAAAALVRYPGQEVAYVGPATKSDAVPPIDTVDGE